MWAEAGDQWSPAKGSLVQRELSAAPPLTEGLSFPSAPSLSINSKSSGTILKPVLLSSLPLWLSRYRRISNGEISMCSSSLERTPTTDFRFMPRMEI